MRLPLRVRFALLAAVLVLLVASLVGTGRLSELSRLAVGAVRIAPRALRRTGWQG